MPAFTLCSAGMLRPPPSLYSASPNDPTEARWALRICLAGMRPPAELTFPGGNFAAWSIDTFHPVIAPHAVQAWELAHRGNADALAAADATLPLPHSSASAGRRLLSRRDGAHFHPVARRFRSHISSGTAPGHFATVMALQAVDFSLGILPLLQALLYCEWFSGQPVHAHRDFPAFLRRAGHTMALLPALLPTYDSPPAKTAFRAR